MLVAEGSTPGHGSDMMVKEAHAAKMMQVHPQHGAC